MSAPMFLAPRADLLEGTQVTLSGPEGRHAVSVVRVKVGEHIDLSDGDGLLIAGRVVEVNNPDELVIEVLERIMDDVVLPRLVVVQAIPKGDRGERAVELLTEVGADAIVPWAASRCIAQWKGDRAEKALTKWENTAKAAGKQARRSRLPQVTGVATTGDVVSMIAAASGAIVLHEESTTALTDWNPPIDGEIVIVVGPEGGITSDEVEAFRQAGAQIVHMGKSIMRTSTAGAAAVAVLGAVTGRWS
ncbi:MAG: 16S rRNA (uracil(1498)-N(3))-methyltransferase [Actinobacteria bacterium]|nr:16S rRNA (uracil(1498)-N(3))-methyltransferase [Actinomycetota bacterium]